MLHANIAMFIWANIFKISTGLGPGIVKRKWAG